ncbi:MAG: iron ABC transporter permease [Alphaproteobacteria bacterium]|nr:iron ABC transporter permease [Alphaproteobacteria bacterium]
MGLGAVRIPPGPTLGILLEPLGVGSPWAFTDQQAAVLTALRLPRALLAALVGMGLAVSGALMQGMFRNPLAEPGLLGVSAGAALAAVSTIVFGGALPEALRPVMTTLGAFVGGLAACALVWRLARVEGRTSVPTMLLAGIAVNAIAMAGTGMITILANDAQLRSITWWTFGSLGGATWAGLALLAPGVLLGCGAGARAGRALNALALGEAEAGHLGVDTEGLKRRLVLVVAGVVGLCVAASGVIGFLGLVVPHLVRLTLGPDHRALVPASALLGATLLLAADLGARTLWMPAELPVGVLTTLLGGPFFLALLTRSRRSGAPA